MQLSDLLQSIQASAFNALSTGVIIVKEAIFVLPFSVAYYGFKIDIMYASEYVHFDVGVDFSERRNQLLHFFSL